MLPSLNKRSWTRWFLRSLGLWGGRGWGSPAKWAVTPRVSWSLPLLLCGVSLLPGGKGVQIQALPRAAL